MMLMAPLGDMKFLMKITLWASVKLALGVNIFKWAFPQMMKLLLTESLQDDDVYIYHYLSFF